MKISIKKLRTIIQETLYSAWSPKHGKDKSIEVEADNTKLAGDLASDELFDKYGIKADPMTIDVKPAEASVIKHPHVMIKIPDPVTTSDQLKEIIYGVETVNGDLTYTILHHNTIDWRSDDYAKFFKEHAVETVSWDSYLNPTIGRSGYALGGDLLNGTYPADEWLAWTRSTE